VGSVEWKYHCTASCFIGVGDIVTQSPWRFVVITIRHVGDIRKSNTPVLAICQGDV